MIKQELIMRALHELVPNCKYKISNFDIDQIEWNDERVQPTKERLLSKISELEELKKEEYKQKNADNIRESMYNYINKNFPIEKQLQMIITYLTYLDKKLSSIDIGDDIAKIDNIKQIWEWFTSVITYGEERIGKAKDGAKIDNTDIDFETLFNKIKPKLK